MLPLKYQSRAQPGGNTLLIHIKSLPGTGGDSTWLTAWLVLLCRGITARVVVEPISPLLGGGGGIPATTIPSAGQWPAVSPLTPNPSGGGGEEGPPATALITRVGAPAPHRISTHLGIETGGGETRLLSTNVNSGLTNVNSGLTNVNSGLTNVNSGLTNVNSGLTNVNSGLLAM